MADLTFALEPLFAEGFTVIPLGLDTNQKPKRPLPLKWQETPHDLVKIKTLPWANAKGLGIVLGRASGNLAVIDIDDQILGRRAFAEMICRHVRTRMVWTVSGNIHLYFREAQPSASTAFKVDFEGRTVGIELKAQGTQVAAPPTPGYTIAAKYVNDDNSYKAPFVPLAVPTVREAWESLAKRLGIAPQSPQDARTGAGYPKPWAETVPAGQRDKAAFVEACRLREAGMPLAQALANMHTRWEKDYAPGEQDWGEIQRTVESAYRRGEFIETGGVDERWRDDL